MSSRSDLLPLMTPAIHSWPSALPGPALFEPSGPGDDFEGLALGVGVQPGEDIEVAFAALISASIASAVTPVKAKSILSIGQS